MGETTTRPKAGTQALRRSEKNNVNLLVIVGSARTVPSLGRSER